MGKNNTYADSFGEKLKISHTKEEIENTPTGFTPNYNGSSEENGLFKVHDVSKWMELTKSYPVPQMLLSEFWHEGDFCILFGDAGVGKTILGMQTGNSISLGEPINGFKLGSQKQIILYFDFEQSDKQFENRYSNNFTDHYFIKRQNNNFKRAVFDNEKFYCKDDNESFFIKELSKTIIDSGAKIAFFDNFNWIKDKVGSEQATINLLLRLKKTFGLSILVLANTLKRKLSTPITENDLRGTKKLIDFADSAFTIGKSSVDKDIRYIKQIKSRHTELIYGEDNVCVCQLTKPTNFMQFEFLNFATEQEHLIRQPLSEKNEVEMRVKALLEAEPEISAYKIAQQLLPPNTELNSYKVTISRIVNRIKCRITGSDRNN